jgi:hypothetical protein
LPLPAPILDDRSYQQLRDELIRRIPVYAREWTDHNPSDPGIALIELFAFLGENVLYRFNQIPEATKLAFLRLLDIPLRPAQPAHALLTVKRKDPGATPVDVPMGSEARAGATSFETLVEVAAWDLETIAVAKANAEEPKGELKAFTDLAIAARGGLQPGEAAAYYVNRLVSAEPSLPDAPVVDFDQTADGFLWVAVLHPDGTVKKEYTDELKTRAGKRGAILNVGFVPDLSVSPADQPQACPGAGASQAGHDVVWKVTTATVGGVAPRLEPLMSDVEVVADTSRGLTQEGVVRLGLPADFGLATLTDPDLVGTGAFPPELEDEAVSARVLFWLRASRVGAHAQSFGRVLYVGLNATEVVQARRVTAEFLGTASGQPSQSFRFVEKNRPILQGSTQVQVEEDDQWVDWAPVESFDASNEDDRHYRVLLADGAIEFGNGVRGRIPEIGQRIRAKEYRTGGGTAGNAAAKAISTVTVDGVEAENPLPARGGSDTEPVKDALERIPGELRRHDRAVTGDDFRELALMTPGAEVGRAECLKLFDPALPLAERRLMRAAGVVSLVVWPRDDRKHPDAPLPDRTLLRQVCRWLDTRRLITTELYVIPPVYREIAVSIAVEVKAGYGVEAVRRWVELVVRQYLAPLPPYGPEGHGWPLGRAVYGRELEAAALQVEGVEFLRGLRLARREAGRWVEVGAIDCVPQPVDLEKWEVPQLSEITVLEADKPLAPGSPVQPEKAPDVPVPIPTPRKEC